LDNLWNHSARNLSLAKKPPKKNQPSSKTTSDQSAQQATDKASQGSRFAVFEADFREDLRFWVDSDRKIALRLMDLVEATMRDPFDGIGKPELLKYLDANT
jgi:hypothetical protein